jgi:hypothetical protein
MIVILNPKNNSHIIDHILFSVSKSELKNLLDKGDIEKEEIHSVLPQKKELEAIRTAQTLLSTHTPTKPFPSVICNPYWSQKADKLG